MPALVVAIFLCPLSYATGFYESFDEFEIHFVVSHDNFHQPEFAKHLRAKYVFKAK